MEDVQVNGRGLSEQGAPLSETIALDTHHYAFIKTHSKYSTNSQPSCINIGSPTVTNEPPIQDAKHRRNVR